MNRRQFLKILGVVGIEALVAGNSFAQVSKQSYESQLAKRVAKYLCEEKKVKYPNPEDIFHKLYSDSAEFVDKTTGENITQKLIKWQYLEGVPFKVGMPIKPEDIPPNAVLYNFTRVSIDLISDNLILFAEAKVYWDNNNNRNYNDSRNSLEVSCFEPGRTLEEMKELAPDVAFGLRKTFGVIFTDKGIDGVVDSIKGSGNQEMYIKCLQQIERLYPSA